MAGSDWRVTATVGRANRQRVLQVLHGHERCRRLSQRVAVSEGGHSQIFLYAGTENDAREAEQIARDVLARCDLTANVALHRWHPGEQAWGRPELDQTMATDASGSPRRPTAGDHAKTIGIVIGELIVEGILEGPF